MPIEDYIIKYITILMIVYFISLSFEMFLV